MPNLSACSGNSTHAATWSPLVGLESENKTWKQIQQLLPGLSTGSPETTSKSSHRINAGFYLLCAVFHAIHSKSSANTELRTENIFFWDSRFRKKLFSLVVRACFMSQRGSEWNLWVSSKPSQDGDFR